MQSFGEYIRALRLSKKLLLREVAARIEVDPSFLSRVERGSKRPTREQVIQLGVVLKANENELLIQYLSDRVVYELKDEKLALKVMQAAEKKIAYLKKKKG